MGGAQAEALALRLFATGVDIHFIQVTIRLNHVRKDGLLTARFSNGGNVEIKGLKGR
jgi:hypothetical protein